MGVPEKKSSGVISSVRQTISGNRRSIMYLLASRHPATGCDFTLSYRGAVSILTPRSTQAEDWLEMNIIVEDTPSFSRGILIKHQYLLDHVRAIKAAGLSIVHEWPETGKTLLDPAGRDVRSVSRHSGEEASAPAFARARE
jgi:hypothetical protein